MINESAHARVLTVEEMEHVEVYWEEIDERDKEITEFLLRKGKLTDDDLV